MKQFDEWYETRNKVSNEYVSEDETGINLARRAFRAGMLEAADIAEAIDLSCDEFVTLEMIAEEIRRAVE